MANPILAALIEQVDRAQSVSASATTLINGIAARIQAAVEVAIANGATEEELAPLQLEIDELLASNDALSAAVSANTPAENL